MNESYDLLIIGAGPAGVTAALRAGELGAQVVVVDRSRTGGTCTNTGCVPTRVLAKTARLLRDIRGAGAYGVEVSPPVLNWPQTRARIQQVVATMHDTKRDEKRISDRNAGLPCSTPFHNHQTHPVS